MFKINYSQLIQYEILEKLVTYMSPNSHVKFIIDSELGVKDPDYLLIVSNVK